MCDAETEAAAAAGSMDGGGEAIEGEEESLCSELIGDDGMYYGGWDATAKAALADGHPLFFDLHRACFIYYGAVCWLNEENGQLYYFDGEGFVYLDEEAVAAIEQEQVPVYPLEEAGEPDSEISGDSIEVTTDQQSLEIASPDTDSNSRPSGPDGGTPVRRASNASLSHAIQAMTPRKSLNAALSGSGALRNADFAKGPPKHGGAALGPAIRPTTGERVNLHRSTTTIARKNSDAVAEFKATDAELFRSAVSSLQVIFNSTDSPRKEEWRKHKNGNYLLGRYKRPMESLVNGQLDLKSVAGCDFAILTANLKHLNLHQLIQVRAYGSFRTAWERAPIEAMRQFALKCDNCLALAACSQLIARTTLSGPLPNSNLLTDADKLYCGLQMLQLLGAIEGGFIEDEVILPDKKVKALEDDGFGAPSNETLNCRGTWWFLPAHPLATMRRAPAATAKPAGLFVQYPSLMVSTELPQAPRVYRMVRSKTSLCGAAHNWQVVVFEIVDQDDSDSQNDAENTKS